METGGARRGYHSKRHVLVRPYSSVPEYIGTAAGAAGAARCMRRIVVSIGGARAARGDESITWYTYAACLRYCVS
eukprot:SAG31_NODE_1523_length_8012_cov_39.769240_12_plen_75_part_00